MPKIDKPRIFMTISCTYPNKHGTERQLELLSEFLRLKGIEVAIVGRRYPGLKTFECLRGVPVYRLYNLGRGVLAGLTFFGPCLFFLLRNANRYNIIHGHLIGMHTFVGSLMALLLKKKLIVKLGGNIVTGHISNLLQRGLWGRFQLLLLLKKADIFVSVNTENIRQLTSLGVSKEKIILIPNGVDTSNFKPVSSEEKDKIKKYLGLHSSKLVTFVGRLEPVKSVDVLLKAWVEVAGIIDTVHLVIVGSGSQEQFLKDFVVTNNIADSVTFVGEVDNVRQYLQVSDLFVLPSLGEGLSNALLEAMACGVPVLASAVGGTLDVIEHDVNGRLFRVGNYHQLAQEIICLLMLLCYISPQNLEKFQW